jgi:hypothetical protein
MELIIRIIPIFNCGREIFRKKEEAGSGGGVAGDVGEEPAGKDAEGEEDIEEVVIGEDDAIGDAEGLAVGLDIGVAEVGDRLDGRGGRDEFEGEEAVVIDLFLLDDTALGGEGLEAEGEGDEGIFKLGNDTEGGLQGVKFLFEAEAEKGLLVLLGFLLLIGGELVGAFWVAGGFLLLDQGKKKVGVVEGADGEVEGVVDDLPDHEVAGMGLHLLKILVDLRNRHDAGRTDMGIVRGFAGVLAGGEVESEHVEVALQGRHEMIGGFLQVELPGLAGIGRCGFLGHVFSEKGQG